MMAEFELSLVERLGWRLEVDWGASRPLYLVG
jgi:hypothetical protein